MRNRTAFLLTVGALIVLVMGACVAPAAPAAEEAAAEGGCAELTPVKLQLQWVTQSQFAGYFAAVDQGFYAEQCLDVTILEGAVDIVPQQVVASGRAEFGLAWVPKVLASRSEGADLVNIAQGASKNGGEFLATSGELHWDAQPATLDNPKSGMHPSPRYSSAAARWKSRGPTRRSPPSPIWRARRSARGALAMNTNCSSPCAARALTRTTRTMSP